MLVTLKSTSHSANIAHKLRNDDIQKDLKSHQIPDKHLTRIINELNNIVGVDIYNTKTTAKLVLDIWNRTCNKPSGIGNTTALIVFYLIFMTLGIITPFAFETSKIISMTRTELVNARDIHGAPILLEVKSYKGYKLSEVVVKNGIYDGPATNWYLSSENKSKEGTWKDGYWHGEWKFWNKKGELESITYYERGRPIRYAMVKGGARVDIPADRWPLPVKQSFQTKPEGPKLKKGE